MGLNQSNYNKVENGKREPTPVTVEDKTVSEKIRPVEQLEEEDKNVIYKMLDTMLAKKKFQDFFQQNISVK